MLFYRKVLLLLSVVMVVGSLSATVGYGLHLRSDRYRGKLETKLSDRFGMRVSIGAIAPLSLRTRRFHDVQVHLPHRGIKVFECGEAVWRNRGRDGGTRYSLDLEDGWLLMGSNEWVREDYDRMLRGGLGHDFASLRLGDVHLDSIDLKWTHPSFTLRAPGCAGEIRFDGNGMGHASLTTNGLNAFTVDEPVNILAHFTPGPRLRFHNVVLKVPEAPLSALGLDHLLGSQVTRGEFAGSVSYQETAAGRVVVLGGTIRNARLAEVTGPLEGGPYDGEVNVEVDEARFIDGVLRALRFSGQLSALQLDQLAPVVRLPGLTGVVDLRVHQARYEEGVLEYLNAEGHGTGLPLGMLTELFGRGRITGSAAIDIDSIIVEGNRLRSANVMLEAVPPQGGVGTIDRAMLKTASEELLGIDATAILPPDVTHIEYARLGVRLIVNRGLLWLHGTHGQDGRTILTAKLFGREYGVMRAPRRTFPIDELLEGIQQRIEQYDSDDLREWWRTRDGESAGSDETG